MELSYAGVGAARVAVCHDDESLCRPEWQRPAGWMKTSALVLRDVGVSVALQGNNV